MKIRHIAMAVAVALTSSYAMANTTSAIRGVVKTAEGQPAAGTKVTVVHVPTGSKSVLTANSSGVFNAVGLRVGGPYKIEVDSDTYNDQTLNDIYLTLGETSNLNVVLETGTAVERIAVTGARVSSLNLDAKGPSSTFSAADIEASPTISRDIKNVVEQDPRIMIDAGNANAIQCAGGSNRSNSLTVDGLEMNDNFGLNANGYPTERLPFPFDAIDQVAVELAPFDVTYGNFTGCAINAVTKSGTNDISGNVFVDYRTDSLQGDKIAGRKINVAPYSEKRYGFTFGMPIIEDELFFFVAYEKHNPNTLFNNGPTGAGFASEIIGLDVATVNRIADVAKNKYGYQVNPLATQAPNVEEKMLAKLDWAINDEHRVFFTFQDTQGDTISTTNSSANNFAFNDHFYTRANFLTSYATQLFSDWSESFSTTIRASWQDVENGQTPRAGQLDFGQFRINNINGNSVFFGPDQFRQANELSYDTLNLSVEGNYFFDEHEVTGGIEYKKTSIFNMFVPSANGVYVFNNLADFEAGKALSIAYSNAPSLNPNDAAASFSLPSYAAYLQDRFTLTDELTMTYGLRYDHWSADSAPTANANFQTRYGFTNAQKMSVGLLQPRLSLNYIVDDSMVVYGGLGLFSGGNPNVWVSNIFSNDGVAILSSSTASLPAGAVRDGALNAANTPNFGFKVPTILTNPTYFRGGDGNVAAIDPDFKASSNWKANIGTQKELTDDLVVGADIIYSVENDPLVTEDLRLQNNGVAPDGRPVYKNCVVNVANPAGACVARGNWDLLLTNSDESAKSFVFSGFADWKPIEGLTTKFGYSFQDVEETHPMTSTTASSNYDSFVTSDPNNASPATSNYETPHRFTLNIGYTLNLIDGYSTRFNLFGQRVQGRAFSYVFNGDPGFGDVLGASRNRNLLYIPAENDAKVVYAPTFNKAAFDAFIAENGLTRGQISGRNDQNSSWWTRVDLKITQDIPTFADGHEGSIYFSIENLGNLLNDDWGSRKQIGFPYNNGIVTATTNAQGQYVYSTFTSPTAQRSLDNSSLWQMVAGIQYRF